MVSLQNNALLLVLLLGQECSTSSMLENLTDTLIRLCGALEILVGANLLANFLTLHMNVSMTLEIASRV